MTDKQRADLAADLEASIGAGATRNREILADQAKTAVSVLAFGFAVVAEDVSHSLNSIKGGYIGDYIGDYYRGY